MTTRHDRLSIRHVRPSLHAAIAMYAREQGITKERAILDVLSQAFSEWENAYKEGRKLVSEATGATDTTSTETESKGATSE